MPAPSLDGKDHKLFGTIEKIGDSSSSWSVEAKKELVRQHANSISVVPDTSHSVSLLEERGSSFKEHGEVGGLEGGQLEPDMDEFNLVTIGSKLHKEGGCKPCDFVSRGQICRHGSECNFCHFHTTLRRTRGGKKKREKMERMKAARGSRADPGKEEAEKPPGGGSASSAAQLDQPVASKVSMSL
mmetsp:Transcript_7294/g.9463  ORF Transcript_7294/g.9463 Transcript_7294/m.9463 type:complete len:185 (+) Transcript_7294:79-633(+)